MAYGIIKGYHLLFVFLWIMGLVFETVLLTKRSTVLESIRAWERWVTNLTMLLVLATGIYLAMAGGWYQASWLKVKFFLVLMLTGYHGFLTMQLKRSSAQKNFKPLLNPTLALIALSAMVIVIVYLAVAKPF